MGKRKERIDHLEETPHSHLTYSDFEDSMISDKQQMKKKVFVSGYKNQACFFVAYHDDSGWCGYSCNHGVYSRYYGQYGDCLSHTVSMLWGDWRVCCNNRKLFDWC